ncbi:olfactory receptor 2D2-like [Protobothrops mucrosquamatus]|uniref:olfactory receptor 2D2-like n=1 Tax=Protobothrops mucrosquamatus TaxID=103944 RepID=UPI0010FB7A78|nr:olfactory receptor 2D2-like [Protobothrops mucrosquamatus]
MEQCNQSSVAEFILLGLAEGAMTETMLFVLFLTIYLVTLVGNCTMVMLIGVEHRLHTPMYFFLLHLSLLDLCYSSVTIPQMLAHLLSRHKAISFGRCAFQMYIFLVFGMAECVLLGLMAYDRYVAICHPLHYTTIMNWHFCSWTAGAAWLSGFLNSLIVNAFALRLPYCTKNRINQFFCEVPAVIKLASADASEAEVVVFVFGSILLLLPFVLIAASYGRIGIAILRIRSAEGQRRAASTCGSHLLVVSLFYGTALFAYMRPSSVSSATGQDKAVSVFYTVVTPMMNPLIYSLRNKEVKGALRKLLSKKTTSPKT